MPDGTRNNQEFFTLTTPAHHPPLFQDQELPVHNNSGKGRYEGNCSFVPRYYDDILIRIFTEYSEDTKDTASLKKRVSYQDTRCRQSCCKECYKNTQRCPGWGRRCTNRCSRHRCRTKGEGP